jgi:hypothetical protein
VGGLSYRIYGTASDNPASIPPAVWECYKNLFPVEAERDEPDHIVIWLNENYHNTNEKWGGLLITIEMDGSCAGLAFMSLYRPLGWWFGNYFGVVRDRRHIGLAPDFWRDIVERCQSIMPDAKGVVFETERYADKDILSAMEKLEAIQSGVGVDLTPKERYGVAAALRIALYTNPRISRIGSRGVGSALAMLISQGDAYSFVDYVQPAIRQPLDQSNEVELWLMIYPFEPLIDGLTRCKDDAAAYEMNSDQLNELFSFLYDHLFHSAHDSEYEGTDGETVLDGYGEYVNKVRRRVQGSLAAKPVVLKGKRLLSPAARQLILSYGRLIDELGLRL